MTMFRPWLKKARAKEANMTNMLSPSPYSHAVDLADRLSSDNPDIYAEALGELSSMIANQRPPYGNKQVPALTVSDEKALACATCGHSFSWHFEGEKPCCGGGVSVHCECIEFVPPPVTSELLQRALLRWIELSSSVECGSIGKQSRTTIMREEFGFSEPTWEHISALEFEIHSLRDFLLSLLTLERTGKVAKLAREQLGVAK